MARHPFVFRSCFFGAFFVFAFHGMGAASPAAEKRIIEEIIVKVNNEIITRSEYERARSGLRQDLARDFSGTELERQFALREKNVLRDLIDQMLLVQKAKDMGLHVETELVKYLDRIREENNLKSLEDLERVAVQQGANFEEFKQNIRNSLYTQHVVRREIGSRITITQEEVNKYYEQNKEKFERSEEVKFREIFFSTENKEPAEIEQIKKKAQDVLQRARKGEDFSELAKKYSEGPTAKQGGEQDYIGRGQLLKEIEETAFKLKKNEVSDVITTKFGLKLIKLEDRHASGIPPVDQVSDQIMNVLYSQRIQPAIREYLTTLRKQSFIEIKPGYDDSGVTPADEKPPK